MVPGARRASLLQEKCLRGRLSANSVTLRRWFDPCLVWRLQTLKASQHFGHLETESKIDQITENLGGSWVPNGQGQPQVAQS